MKYLLRPFLVVLVFLFAASAALAQTGRIEGTVVDAGTGELLPGVNVVIAGTQQGAVTNVEGYYTIVGVRPGTYTLRASFVGYTEQTITDVRVNVGLTTSADFELQDAAIGLDEVFVTAERPIVQRDISANIATLSASDVENLPVLSVEGIIGLQAGIEPGMNVRGGGGADVGFFVDGMNMSDGRENNPATGVSYTSIEEIQVQTGGFDAEYGELRSGLINVTTREGPRDRYTADVLMRYTPPSQKNFGGLATDPDSYNQRPYLDPDVAFVGTENGPWDIYTQRSHPTFQGWNAVSEDRFGGDLTPQQLQEAHLWLTRRDASIQTPDYQLDATIGGPVPGGQSLGSLRFIASYRETQEAFMIPQHREAYQSRLGQGKINADLGTGMRLAVQGIYTMEEGLNYNNQAQPWAFDRGEVPNYAWDTRSQLGATRMGDMRDWVADSYRHMPSDIERITLGAELTHMVSPTTFYEVRLQRMHTDYLVGAPPERDRETILYTVEGGDTLIEFDEAPIGWVLPYVDNPIGGTFNLGGQWAMGRDSSQVTRWTVGLDVTSQMNRYVQTKAGLEYIYSDYNVRHGQWDPANPHHANPKYRWSRQPQQGAAYARTKLEFQGMVANLGLRLDYFNGGGEWWSLDDPFTGAFSPRFGGDLEAAGLEQEPVKHLVSLSPRVGISFPITDNSKLYFNYGHMRRSPNPSQIFQIQQIQSGAVSHIGDPNIPLTRTVAYEIGYEHNIIDKFLLRVGGYYRDNSQETQNVNFQNIDGQVVYNRPFPYGYSDVRGFELTLTKVRGDWLRGFANYTYRSSRGGRFGIDQMFQNPVRQRQYESTYIPGYGVATPEPFARFNLEFLVPENLGPQIGDSYPLGDWRINFLGEWRSGWVHHWNGSDRQSTRLIFNNVKWRDWYNLDMRFSKAFSVAGSQMQFFMDMTNVFNFRHMTTGAFAGQENLLRYYQSLHLPEDTFEALDENPYVFRPGSDRPGDMRKAGVDFVPIRAFTSFDDLPGAANANEHQRTQGFQGPLYWVQETDSWYAWDGSSYVDAGQAGIDVDQVLRDKAYIEMPYQGYRMAFNPRNVFFGLRFAF